MQGWERITIQHIPIDDTEESELPIDFLDSAIDIEEFIFKIKELDTVTILTLKALGFKYQDIIKILDITPNRYYALLNELKRDAVLWSEENKC